MTYEAHAVRLSDGVHRYFPEWADRPDSADPFLEADHNSYLAGGYSEEFGYHVWPDRPPAFPLLPGDPEHSREWRVQIGCLHPGYPECSRPADRGSHSEIAGTTSFDGDDAGAPPPDANRRAGLTGIVRVDRRGAERHVVLPIMGFWARLRIRSRVRDPGI